MVFRRLYRQSILSTALVAVLSVPSSLVFYSRLNQETTAANKLTLVRQETEAIDNLTTQLLNLETGVRGYLSSGDRRFLDPYWEGKRLVPIALGQLEEIEPNTDGLRGKVEQILALSDQIIREGSTQAILEQGKARMDEIRTILGNLRTRTEMLRDRLLREREDRQQRDLILAILSAAATLLLVWLLYHSATNMRVAFKKAEESLIVEERLRKADQELSEAKSIIIQTISHEYRTPLTVILSATELLAAYADNPERRVRYLDQVRRGVRRLDAMIDDVLEIFRLESGAVTVNPRPLDLRPWFSELVELLQGSDRIILDIQVEKIHSDEALLYKIFSNLLSNALKYSKDEVVVVVKVTAAETLRFSVKDKGIGIPHSMRIFQPFERGLNVGRVPGTGLGLSIVKKAVELSGGAIQIESQEGEGTEVVVILPS